MNPKLKPMIPAFLMLLAGLVALGVAWYSVANSPEYATESAIEGKFSLIDHDGNPVTEADFNGKPYLVYFGFTFCPDICPTTLYEVSTILKELGDDADKLNVIFVSVDYERDTKEMLKDYTASFGPQFIGMTGDKEQINAAAKSFRVFYRKVPLNGSDYTIDHTSVVYLFNKDGRFVAPFDYKRDPAEAAAVLRKVL